MRNIRLCVDATPILLRSAGVKTYLYHWTRHLIAQAEANQVSVFPYLQDLGDCHHELSPLGYVPTMARIALLQSANYLGAWVLSPLGKSVDIFHASNQLRNPPKNTRVTATLFDMTCWLMPETHSAANVAATKRYAERVMRPARGLISISGQSRDDAVRILGLDPGRITVIYPGIAEAYFEATVEMGSVTAARYGLHRPYLLFVGTVEPRKNIGVLLDAWQLMPPALREAFELVVVGSPGWGDPIVLKRLRAGAGGVRYLGYVPEADLPALTKAAAVFVYPSLYEGFGLPVGQAMAAGVPVVTSSVSCLPEVAGGAAVLADPRSAEEVRSAMVRLLESPERRASLGETGALRARQEFRWEVCAQRSWEFFENLA